MDIIVHLTDERWGKGAKLFYSNLYNQDETVSFMYKFIFGTHVLEYAYEKKNQKHVIREN